MVEQADKILVFDGCLNFFAEPTNPEFAAKYNFYNVYYNITHVTGNSSGNTQDMIESIDMMTKELINPSAMITHIEGKTDPMFAKLAEIVFRHNGLWCVEAEKY